MNTLFYKYALEVARTKSITQAAENLFMAQPNLSKAIKEMEDSLGFVVFERSSKGVMPTVKGERFLEHAHNIVLQLEKIEHIADTGNAAGQRLSVCMPRGSYISVAITKFVGQLDVAKEIHVNLQETNAMQTMRNVAEGKFNLGVIRYQTIYEPYFKNYLKEKGLEAELVWDFSYYALVSQKHVLADCVAVEKEALEDSIEIVHGDTVIPYLVTEKEDVKEKTEKPKKRIYIYERANQFEILSQVSNTYMWTSQIPVDMLNRYGLVQLKCDYQDNQYKDLLIYKKGYRFTAYDKQFIDLLYEAKNSVRF